jgi:flagellar L-ring protein precursor FlgH
MRIAATACLLAGIAAAASAGADSLYKPGTFQPLTADLRARHVGDVLTIVVSENAAATSAADTSAGRAAAAAFDVAGPGKRLAGNIGTSNQLDGHGRTQREGRVLAQLTVTVRAVLPSGDLVVGGDQLVEINRESQRISVEGQVRAHDVSDQNTVLSSRLANARIRYAGQGDLSDRQRPAWWQHFLSLFGI